MTAGATLTNLADAVGRAALPLFAGTLATLLVVVALGGKWALRHTHVRDQARVKSLAELAVRLAIGFAVVVIAAWAFAAIAGEIGDGETLGRFDVMVSKAIGAHASAPTLAFFATITHLGDGAIQTAICIAGALVLLYCRERGLALAWVVAIAGNGVLNRTLKEIFARVRPVHDMSVVTADGWSFPSGHSSGSVVVYGMLAYLVIRTLPPRYHLRALLVATAIVFTTACSRIFLQVHYPSDVAAGLASGMTWLAICVISVETARHYRQRRAR